ncbi:hypothetical protein TSACC_2542 [Terrimicrobium sacchariphilum]|uniref:Colicin V production protein n=1 Tax=Terrimicrobium sacchariphilum TaxID=690879 RepID=A0A146G2S8_TERSA|nr:hypothetical protein [Terrimicrobium sacchariphilum]GAT32145.1 hypothetical protein TSACC_2542 [Terrimicrobium sacchariphilum]
MIQGSPNLQAILLGIAALFLAFEFWRGWRAGLVRAGLNLGAIVASSMFGLVAGRVAASLFGGADSFTGLTTGVLVGLAVAIVVFAAIWILGAVLFKRTEHQRTFLFRLLWGLGGGICGLILGLLVVWGGVSIIRTFGTFAESSLKSQAAAPPVHTARPHIGPHVVGAQPQPTPSGLLAALASTKESLEMGPAGKLIAATDPIPDDAYQLLSELTRISTDPEIMARFLQYPDIQRVVQSPKFVAALGDPTVIDAAQRKDLPALVSNKALIAAVQDPAFAEQLAKVDLRAAMNFALEKPSPSPAPSPTTATKKK